MQDAGVYVARAAGQANRGAGVPGHSCRRVGGGGPPSRHAPGSVIPCFVSDCLTVLVWPVNVWAAGVLSHVMLLGRGAPGRDVFQFVIPLLSSDSVTGSYLLVDM